MIVGRARELDELAPFPEDAELPTRAHPQLAMVLVPSQGPGQVPDQDLQEGGGTPADPDSTDDEPWVFPFDQPLPPDEGDNQALAVNTTDDSVTYDVAFAMVWATGDEVLNVNEAHAYASCSDCVAVAVAFQVVLIMDDAQVVVPQNLAVAANYDCYQCITAAIASQLVLSVEEEPGEQQLLALVEVWDRLIEFGQNITSYTLAEITAQLDAIKAEIVAILYDASPVPPPGQTTAPSPSGTEEPDGEATPSDSPTPTPTESSTSSPAPSSPSSEPTAEPTTEPTPTQTTPTPSEETTTPAPTPTSPAPTSSTSSP